MLGLCRFGRIHGKAIIGAGAFLCFVFLLVLWNKELFTSKNGVVQYTHVLNPVNTPKLDERDGQKSQSTENPPLDYEMIRNLARIEKPFGNSILSTTEVPAQNFGRVERMNQNNITSVGNRNINENLTRNEDQAEDRRKSKSVENKSMSSIQNYTAFEKSVRNTLVGNVVGNDTMREKTVISEISAKAAILDEDTTQDLSAVKKTIQNVTNEVFQDLTQTRHPVENLIQIKNLSHYFTGENTVETTEFMSLVHSRDSHSTPKPSRDLPSTQNLKENLSPTEEVIPEFLSTQTIIQDITKRPVRISSPPPTQESIQNFDKTEKAPQNLVTKEVVLGKIKRKASQIVLESSDIAVETWLNNGNLSYDDPLLIEYVGSHLLSPPAIKSISTKFETNNGNHSVHKIQTVWNILRNVTDGFYIDCGSNNGELDSNSLWLEDVKGWNGLIIQADPEKSSVLKSKYPKAWHANVCLSKDIVPKMSSLLLNVKESGLHGSSNDLIFEEIKVKCIPVYTILLAMKRNVVDFFSLNMEGLELNVLKTIPFDKIKFKTLAITNWRTPGGSGSVLEEFMEEKGYTLIQDTNTVLPQDSIFVLNSVLHEKSEETTRKYKLNTNTAGSNKESASVPWQSTKSSKHKTKVFNLH